MYIFRNVILASRDFYAKDAILMECFRTAYVFPLLSSLVSYTNRLAVYNPENNHTYLLSSDATSFPDALLAASNISYLSKFSLNSSIYLYNLILFYIIRYNGVPGFLATITSEAEQNFVNNIITNSQPFGDFWLGSQKSSEGMRNMI